MAPLIISFDGNIGSGKSTIVKYFQDNFQGFLNKGNKGNDLKLCFLQEPVHIWETIKDRNGQNAIQKFYADNEKYAFPFQMMAYISRLSIFKKALTEEYDIIITERSVFTDRNVFAKMLYEAKKMNEIEYQIYNKWFDEFADYVKNMKIVYIQTSPEICFDRIKKRSRTGEADIPLAYLTECHQFHERWLNDEAVLFIDGNVNVDTELASGNKIYEDIMERVYEFMNFTKKT